MKRRRPWAFLTVHRLRVFERAPRPQWVLGDNGLPILTVEPDLDQYFRKNVIGGPGAFAISAKNYDQFAEAILRKLVTEISRNSTKSPMLALK